MGTPVAFETVAQYSLSPIRSLSAEGRTMDTISAGRQCSQRVGHRQAAIGMPMPVDPDLLSRGTDDFVNHKAHQGADARRRRMADGIADHDPRRAVFDGGGIKQ